MDKELTRRVLDAYKPPFEADWCGNIFTSDGTLALQAVDSEPADNLLVRIVCCLLNGEGCWPRGINIAIKAGADAGAPFVRIDGWTMTVRGWGHLTGQGAMNLPYKEADAIQIAFAVWCAERLKGDVEPYKND